MYHSIPKDAKQLLPREAYISKEWYEREQADLFGKSWTCAGVTTDFKTAGDFVAFRIGKHSLAVVKGADGNLRAFHNICRHRGAEILEEGTGNAGKYLTCPYHRWFFDLEGQMRGGANLAECFPGLDKKEMSLHPASIGVLGDLIFVHPDPDPDEPFEEWSAGVPRWPHDLSDASLVHTRLVFEMNCNWKVYFENSVDGYHLSNLHTNTLGGPVPTMNVWEAYNRHLVWYSIETGKKTPMPESIRQRMEGALAKFGMELPVLESAAERDFPGVYMLFPTTILQPGPGHFRLAKLVPVNPDLTLLEVRAWQVAAEDGQGREAEAKHPGLDPKDGRVKLSRLTQHPLEHGKQHLDSAIEDIWMCEKMQRALHSPMSSVGDLADGAGGEAPLTFFQQNVLDFVRPLSGGIGAGA